MSPVVVTSIPFEGRAAAAAADAAAAAQLALDDAGRPAQQRVVHADPESFGRDPASIARAAAADADVVVYLGDWRSAMTLSTLPILEAAGLPQVSFSNTFRGLAGASFFNVMPNDEALAEDLVAWMLELGVERLYLTEADGDYGLDMRLLVHRAWARAGRRVMGAAGFGNAPVLVDDLPDIDAAFLGAAARPGAVAALRELHTKAPDALLFGMDGLVDDSLVAALPDAVQALLRLGSAALRGERLPHAGRHVNARLAQQLGHAPDPHAVYAYEAMALIVDALTAAGPNRAGITAFLRALEARDSILGRYRFDTVGATTLARGGRLLWDGERLAAA
jgi:ABC-type branched-subunit amino acid transport system substrate-binding protein